jgi:hypothetical protein
MGDTVGAVFASHEDAMHGIGELRTAGFRADQVTVFVPDPREAEGFADELGASVVRAGAVGITAGGVLGGLAGWLVGLTSLAIPGVGVIVAAGPLVGALIGAVEGASLGGFLGMLLGLGMPHHAAEEYDRELREGRTLVFVEAGADYGLAEQALYHARPLSLRHYAEGFAATSAAPPAPPDLPRVEPAAPDSARTPADMAEAVDGQRVMGHTQYLNEPDLRSTPGTTDT